jgi:hypothetical protein
MQMGVRQRVGTVLQLGAKILSLSSLGRLPSPRQAAAVVRQHDGDLRGHPQCHAPDPAELLVPVSARLGGEQTMGRACLLGRPLPCGSLAALQQLPAGQRPRRPRRPT